MAEPQIISNDNPSKMIMCNTNNRGCVWEKDCCLTSDHILQFSPAHLRRSFKINRQNMKWIKTSIGGIVMIGKRWFVLIAGWTLNVLCPDKQAEFGSLISYSGSSLESVMRMLIFVLIIEWPARVLILLSCVPPTLLLGNMDANCQHVNWNYSPSN